MTSQTAIETRVDRVILPGVDTSPGPQPPLTPPSQGGENWVACASFPLLAKGGFCVGTMQALGALAFPRWWPPVP